MRNWKRTFTLALIVMILLIVALVTPWFTLKSEMENDISSVDQTVNLKLYEVNLKVEGSGEEIEESISYDDQNIIPESAIKVFEYTMYITIAALIMAILLIVFVFLTTKKGILMLRIGMVLALLTFIFALTAPMYFMVEFSSEVEKDVLEFFGSETLEISGFSNKLSWGGSVGWFLAIIASFLSLAVFIDLYLMHKYETRRPDYSYYSGGPVGEPYQEPPMMAHPSEQYDDQPLPQRHPYPPPPPPPPGQDPRRPPPPPEYY